MKGGKRYVIDGQQRLTSITLILIFLNNLQRSRDDKVSLSDLIFSEKYSEKSYNLQIEDRINCINALYTDRDFDPQGSGESIKNIVDRYHDIELQFPPELKTKALPYFIDWLINNVIMVEIKTHSDDDAYIIFETMNDRGLNLTSTEMLKGYLLSKIDPIENIKMNDLWKHRIARLKEHDKEEDLEFFKAWLRAKYAVTIRPTKEGAENEDFEKIATRFHSWVRDNKEKIGLHQKSDFVNFVKNEFEFYSNLYLDILKTSSDFDKKLEHVYYVQSLRFPGSFYTSLLMAPVERTDDLNTRITKMNLVARFIETFVVFRRVNNHTTASSSIRYTMFSLIKEIRNKSVSELSEILKNKVSEQENIDNMSEFELDQRNKNFVRFLLARITHHIEDKCGIQSSFDKYFERDVDKPYEIEHIWSNKFEDHVDEFEQKQEFESYRNRLGS